MHRGLGLVKKIYRGLRGLAGNEKWDSGKQVHRPASEIRLSPRLIALAGCQGLWNEIRCGNGGVAVPLPFKARAEIRLNGFIFRPAEIDRA